MTAPPPSQPPAAPDPWDSVVAGASPDDLQRALRVLIGTGQAYWERDLVTGQTWYSPGFHDALGLPGAIDRDGANERIHPDDRPVFERAYADALRRGGPFTYDVRYLDAAGRYRWARSVGRVWLDPASGQPLRLGGMLKDVDAEHQARLDALDHEQRFQRALDASSEAYFERIAGTDEFVVSDNLTRLLGYPPGTPAPDLATYVSWVHPDDAAPVAAEVQRASSEPGAWERTYRLRCADGQWRWFRARGRTAPDSAGRLRMTGLIGDVHAQQLDREELAQHRQHLRRMVGERTVELDAALADARQQREQAERASLAKSEFLAHMSHELRTPLNGVLGLTDLALKVATDPAQQRYLQVALASGRSLLQLINEVLDFSRMDAGSVTLAQEPFDAAETLAEVMRTVMPEVRDKGLLMRYDWVGPSGWVVGDAARVRQVLTNLVANAAKFTQRGHVTVCGEVKPGPDGIARVSFTIEDTGPGIDPTQRERVFDAFVQGDASLTRAHGGTGLGLAIARRLARAMGGDVTIEHSGPGGSRFGFGWPTRCVPDPRLAPAAGSGHAWLVYGDPQQVHWLGGRIERLGWTYEGCGNLGALLQRARSEPPPALVAISEQALPAHADMASVRAALPATRIVLLVRPDWNVPPVEQAAARLGMAIAVTPLAPHALLALLTGPAPANAPAASVAAAAARVLVVEDNPVNLLIAQEFLRQLGHDAQGAVDGRAAVAHCLHTPPALVLMDLQMPVMDGLEATRQLRALQAQGRLPAFPIVALTAHASDADRQQSAAAGMDGHLAKPILADMLKQALARWLGPPGAPGPGTTTRS